MFDADGRKARSLRKPLSLSVSKLSSREAPTHRRSLLLRRFHSVALGGCPQEEAPIANPRRSRRIHPLRRSPLLRKRNPPESARRWPFAGLLEYYIPSRRVSVGALRRSSAGWLSSYSQLGAI